MKQKGMVRNVIFDTVKKQKWLSLGIVVAVVGAVVATLIPPLILAKIVDTITAGTGVSVPFIVLYFLMLALTGFLESAREGLLTVFGQKITHALRSRLMEKFVNLTADSINQPRSRVRWFPVLSVMWTPWKISLPQVSSACLRTPARSSAFWS